MSKIQDALQRFQSGKSQTPSPEPVVRAPAATPPRKRVESGASQVLNALVEVKLRDLRDAGLMTSVSNEKVLSNQYRDIKRPLIASALGKRATKVDDGNLIMVTSAISGEGKSFTSTNLAMSIAREQDLSVVLVDADVAKPHLSSVFGLGDRPGLLDLLEGNIDKLGQVIYPTSIEGLSVLPAGAPRPHAAELLSGSRMESTLRHLADIDPDRIVVFDTPPLLQSSESKALLSVAGQVVFVVKAGSTTQGTVANALQELDDQKAVNLVLNQVPSGHGVYSGGYGYGYGYSYKSDDDSVEATSETAVEPSNGSIFNS